MIEALMKYQAVKGTYDILPSHLAKEIYNDSSKWDYVYAIAADVLSKFGVKEITPPMFEQVEVLTKAAGEGSDIVVQKEMFSFEDAAGRQLALRPEHTGSVMRAYIQHGMHVQPNPVKLWTKGPVFRAEVNTQRGRFRQFQQVNCEYLGLDNPMIDAEVIRLLYTLLSQLGIKNMTVKLGSVGDPEDRLEYNTYLRDYLEPIKDQLSEVSQTRLALNPMRILDSKEKQDQELIKDLDRPLDRLNPDSKAHFDEICGYLESWDIPFEKDDSIVRGLDYYRRTAFEVHHNSIGSQAVICGGGRYDGLIKSLGGGDTPGIGWAFGVERVLDAMLQDEVAFPEADSPLIYLIPLDEDAVSEVIETALNLRKDYYVEFAYVKRKVGKGLQAAEKAGATYAALRGGSEREKSIYQLKHLATGEQQEISETDLASFLANL